MLAISWLRDASFFQGHNAPRKFIAAQGPTKETASDFLRMILEKDIKAVLMLTQIYEGEPPMVTLFSQIDNKID